MANDNLRWHWCSNLAHWVKGIGRDRPTSRESVETLTGRRRDALFISPCLLAVVALGFPEPAAAQRTGENAITSADDAFGSQVGDQRIGLYSDSDVRGFSPMKAGNLRIDGVYFDQVAYPNFATGEIVRVGPAALDYPFPAPTGIVDYQIRIPGDHRVVTPSAALTPYGGYELKAEAQFPLIEDHLSVWTNATYQPVRNAEGAGFDPWNVGLIVRARGEDTELLGIAGYNEFHNQTKAPIVVAAGPFVPQVPSDSLHLGQSWAISRNNNSNIGLILRQRLDESWSFRGGVWDSRTSVLHNFTQVMTIAQPDGLGRDLVISDPPSHGESVSGEGQLAWVHDRGRVRHRILLLVRGRDRTTESGGSDAHDLGPVMLGQPDPRPAPDFTFRPVNVGRIRQVTAGAGYVGRLDGIGQLNLGVQKTDYSASANRGGLTSATRDAPWLYNASLVITPRRGLSVFASYVTGLEDSGVSPDNAANRGEQLPASRTRQIDGGIRFVRGSFRLVASGFDIEKPYFSFDPSNRFTMMGEVRHRGVEASAAQQFGQRLNLLAGIVLLDPVVTGEARDRGEVGKRPVGTTSTLLRLDADYRTSIEGLSINASLVHSGKRTASAQTFSGLGGRQLQIDASTVLDLGARYRFKAAGTPMSVRFLLSNVFDKQSWSIVAPSSYLPNNGRAVTLEVVADF